LQALPCWDVLINLQATRNMANANHHIWGQVEMLSSCSGDTSSDGFEAPPPHDFKTHGDPLHSPGNNLKAQRLCGCIGEVVFHPESDSGGASSHRSLEQNEASPAMINRGPSWSSGAELHQSGECNPCAWNWRPRGCVNAQDCKFCHMCEEGALKLRRKERVAKLKADRAAQNVNEMRLDICDNSQETRPSLTHAGIAETLQDSSTSPSDYPPTMRESF